LRTENLITLLGKRDVNIAHLVITFSCQCYQCYCCYSWLCGWCLYRVIMEAMQSSMYVEQLTVHASWH